MRTAEATTTSPTLLGRNFMSTRKRGKRVLGGTRGRFGDVVARRRPPGLGPDLTLPTQAVL